MSLLMFRHEEQAAIIITDSLSTTPEGEPFIFQTKAWPIPHLNMAMAITGLANFGAAWNEYLRSNVLALDVAMIDGIARPALQQVWRDLLGRHPEDAALTSTIYHFGFVEGSDQLVRYVYRSDRDFESERVDQTGFGVKPQPRGFDLAVPATLKEHIELASRIRAEQDALTADERVYIGGELYMTLLQSWSSQTRRIHRFDDFDRTWMAMSRRLHLEQ